MTPSPASPFRIALTWLPLAAFVGAALYALAFYLFIVPSRQVPDEEYRQALDIVRKGYTEGDVVAVLPPWAQRFREFTKGLPIANASDLVAEDLSRYGRLWLILLQDPGSDQVERLDQRYPLMEAHPLGRLTLRLYRLPGPERVLYDFSLHARDAKVEVIRGESATPCDRWVKDRWLCGGGDWNFVGPEIFEFGDDPRRVLWAHPVEGAKLRITFPSVPLGRSLKGYLGLTSVAVRTADGPVFLTILVNDARVAEETAENRMGVAFFAVDTSASGQGSHKVTFEVHAPSVGVRLFGFHAESRE